MSIYGSRVRLDMAGKQTEASAELGECDWDECDLEAAKYIRLDRYVGPNDKVILCSEHVKQWKAGVAGVRQTSLKSYWR